MTLYPDLYSAVFHVFCRIEDLPPPTKKLTPELTPMVLFTGFEPMQVQQYIKVTFALTSCKLRGSICVLVL